MFILCDEAKYFIFESLDKLKRQRENVRIFCKCKTIPSKNKQRIEMLGLCSVPLPKNDNKKSKRAHVALRKMIV